MSKEAGKTRLAAKRQPPKKAGRRQHDLEVQPIDLESQAEALTISRERHSRLLDTDESRDIQHRVRNCPYKRIG